MLKDRKYFAILLANKGVNLLEIVKELSLKHNIKYNRAKLEGDDEYSYVLYMKPNDTWKIANAVKNKHIKFLSKENIISGIIDVNDKGDLLYIYGLSDTDTGAGKIEGDIITPNLKPQFKNMKKVQLVSSKQLDEEHPYEYEHFCFYLREFE